jgi:hypothetical protein
VGGRREPATDPAGMAGVVETSWRNYRQYIKARPSIPPFRPPGLTLTHGARNIRRGLKGPPTLVSSPSACRRTGTRTMGRQPRPRGTQMPGPAYSPPLPTLSCNSTPWLYLAPNDALRRTISICHLTCWISEGNASGEEEAASGGLADALGQVKGGPSLWGPCGCARAGGAAVGQRGGTGAFPASYLIKPTHVTYDGQGGLLPDTK